MFSTACLCRGRNVCKAFGFEAKAALRKATGTNAEFKVGSAEGGNGLLLRSDEGTWRLFSQREVERRLL